MGEIGERHHKTHEDGGNDEIDITGLEGATQIEDTPVNGHTTIGISSNWAYDEDVALRALIEATLPWSIFIDVFPTAKSNVNWDIFQQYAAFIHNMVKKSSGAQNAEITWDVVLAAGTWAVELVHSKETDRGIYSVQIDSVEKGTIDGYAAGLTGDSRDSITGIAIPTTQKIELKLKMATKNGSSSAYTGALMGVRFIRTA